MSIQQINRDDTNWWDLGACRGLDAAIFYPDDENEAQAAKSVCESCTVKQLCLDHALTHREKSGVWAAPPNAIAAGSSGSVVARTERTRQPIRLAVHEPDPVG